MNVIYLIINKVILNTIKFAESINEILKSFTFVPFMKLLTK